MAEKELDPFMNVNAFATDAYRGKPAIVLSTGQNLPFETRKKVAQHFDRPITAFVYLSLRRSLQKSF